MTSTVIQSSLHSIPMTTQFPLVCQRAILEKHQRSFTCDLDDGRLLISSRVFQGILTTERILNCPQPVLSFSMLAQCLLAKMLIMNASEVVNLFWHPHGVERCAAAAIVVHFSGGIVAQRHLYFNEMCLIVSLCSNSFYYND
eukprot:gnl/MRDRNA2_/MRDRNA2_82261_c0_seq1.p1 gnl/MRDRNA2_/MRDRNA2_82261_c0~~gnl/MRDRNA2_/MRDRNA2_82261_c0_seq1.p1  ORF type:complete len:157 (-),score=6.09 gnl/MRDRNA2_/MRDRNA2_82261_c0_seq1:300-725(-)